MSETFTSTAAVQQLLSATSCLADLICQGLIQKRVDRVTWFIICKGRRLRKCFNEEGEYPIELILSVDLLLTMLLSDNNWEEHCSCSDRLFLSCVILMSWR